MSEGRQAAYATPGDYLAWCIRSAYEYLPTDDVHLRPAFDAQRALARSGRRRALGIADLLTAVLAAQQRMTIVHDDAGFEIAAEVLAFEH